MDTEAEPTVDITERLVTSVAEEPLDPTLALRTVQGETAGAAVLFTGVVRNHDGGRQVRRLEYSAHPTAAAILREIGEELLAEHPALHGVVARHRVGPLDIGDVALVAAVSSAHRRESFLAGEDLVERVKKRIPIWKLQVFADGSEEWVNSP